jgi:hypothetical protein
VEAPSILPGSVFLDRFFAAPGTTMLEVFRTALGRAFALKASATLGESAPKRGAPYNRKSTTRTLALINDVLLFVFRAI